jgi:hypothetical protein
LDVSLILDHEGLAEWHETDLDDRIKQLKKAGIESKSVMRGEHVSVITITDPDGNQVVFAHGKGEKHRAVAN